MRRVARVVHRRYGQIILLGFHNQMCLVNKDLCLQWSAYALTAQENPQKITSTTDSKPVNKICSPTYQPVCVLLRDVFSLCPLSDCADSCAVSFISSGWGDRTHGLARRDIRITTSQTLSMNQTPTCCLLRVQLSHFHPWNHSENSCALPLGSKTGWLHTGISREGEGKWILFFPNYEEDWKLMSGHKSVLI